jgi:hypothetical protein
MPRNRGTVAKTYGRTRWATAGGAGPRSPAHYGWVERLYASKIANVAISSVAHTAATTKCIRLRTAARSSAVSLRGGLAAAGGSGAGGSGAGERLLRTFSRDLLVCGAAGGMAADFVTISGTSGSSSGGVGEGDKSAAGGRTAGALVGVVPAGGAAATDFSLGPGAAGSRASRAVGGGGGGGAPPLGGNAVGGGGGGGAAAGSGDPASLPHWRQTALPASSTAPQRGHSWLGGGGGGLDKALVR